MSSIVSAVPAHSVKVFTQATLNQQAARAAAVATIPPDLPRILRRPQVEVMTGLKKTALYDLMKAGEFPRTIPLGNRARGWLAGEVAAWIDSRTSLRG